MACGFDSRQAHQRGHRANDRLSQCQTMTGQSSRDVWYASILNSLIRVFSSAGQSLRLITGKSQVRSLQDPPVLCWLCLRLRGRSSSRSAISARNTVGVPRPPARGRAAPSDASGGAIRSYGGIGRHIGFKSRWRRRRPGSTPGRSTTIATTRLMDTYIGARCYWAYRADSQSFFRRSLTIQFLFPE